MPFQQLPDRVTGQILGASYLNALSENAETLFGAANARNMPFQGFSNSLIGGIDAGDCFWYWRHKTGLDYLHYEIVVGGELDYVRIIANDFSVTNTNLFINETPGSGDRVFVGTADLSGLTGDKIYRMWVDLDFVGSESSVQVKMLIPADSNTFTTGAIGAYEVPPQWNRGDTVNAASMNKYKSALDAAHSLLRDEQFIIPVRQNNTEDRGYVNWHKYRWLIYIGDGKISPIPDGAFADVSISGDGADMVVYDLLSVDWLVPGTLYRVEDCTFAFESELPTLNA